MERDMTSFLEWVLMVKPEELHRDAAMIPVLGGQAYSEPTHNLLGFTSLVLKCRNTSVSYMIEV